MSDSQNLMFVAAALAACFGRLLVPSRRTPRVVRPHRRYGRCVAFTIALLAMLGATDRSAAGATIFVTTPVQKVSSSGGCSRQEAIYSANFDNNIAIYRVNPDGSDYFITTQCVPGNGHDTIVLPTGNLVFLLGNIVDDAHNYLGPTATPIIFSNITIEANGSTLVWNGSHARAFTVGFGMRHYPRGSGFAAQEARRIHDEKGCSDGV